jgi:hypothetical protein
MKYLLCISLCWLSSLVYCIPLERPTGIAVRLRFDPARYTCQRFEPFLVSINGNLSIDFVQSDTDGCFWHLPNLDENKHKFGLIVSRDSIIFDTLTIADIFPERNAVTLVQMVISSVRPSVWSDFDTIIPVAQILDWESDTLFVKHIFNDGSGK